MFNIIRKLDIYGTKIQLNFNGKGSSHNTYLGGLFTLLGKVTVLTYTLYLAHDLVTFNNDTTST